MVTAALVVMTILGCDDGVSQCHYVDTVKGSWETVAACDAQSQKKLPSYTNVNYPVVVAMCEKSGDSAIADMAKSEPPSPTPAPNPPVSNPQALAIPAPATADAVPVPPATPAPLPKRAYAMIRGILPDGHLIRQALTAPVHYLGDGYSWVARKVSP